MDESCLMESWLAALRFGVVLFFSPPTLLPIINFHEATFLVTCSESVGLRGKY